MTDRRRFLALAGLGLWAARAPGADEPTSLAYAIDVDNFWKSLPILDRLKKVADAGFAHYMFTNYRAKDIAAIDKLGRELNLTPLRFLAFRGIADPKRKDEFLEAIDDATEAATTLGVKSLRIDVGPVVDGVEPEPMRDAVVDALKEAVDKAKEQGITFLIDPPNPRDRPFLGSRAEAVAILDAVGSADLKLLEAIDPAAFQARPPPFRRLRPSRSRRPPASPAS